MSAGTATTTIRRSKRGRTIHRLERRLKQFRDVLRVALPFLPLKVRNEAGVLLERVKEPEVEKAPTPGEYADMDAQRTSRLFVATKLYQNIGSKGFLGRIAWAVKYIFCGIGGDE